MNGSALFCILGLVTVAVMLKLLSSRNLRCHWCGVRLAAWEHPEQPCENCKRLRPT